jgi:hypothetical protein
VSNALDLDWDAIQHLAVPESVDVLLAERLGVELLEDPLAIRVFEWQMNHVREHGKPATASVLEHQFNEVTTSEPQTTVGDLIQRLRDRYGRNKAQEVLERIATKSLKAPSELPKELISEGRKLQGLLSARGQAYTQEDYERAIKGYHTRKARGRGPSLGFTELDEHFYGQLGLTFLVGAPKSGKSWFTIKAVHANIMDDKLPYLFSLELPAEETDWRLRCMAAQVPYWKYIQGKLGQDELKQIQEASEILKDWGHYVVEKPPPGKRGVDHLVQQALDSGSQALFIDQLQYVENRRGIAVGATNDTKDYFEVINDFRDASDAIPTWIVHQFNRSIMSASEMPEMQQIKASAAVEECGTLVLGLWANKEMRKSNLIRIGTLAARNYGHQAWEAKMQMRNSCSISVVGKAE